MQVPAVQRGGHRIMSALLEVNHLKKYYPLKKENHRKGGSFVRAVDDVSFSVASCETLGVVGESGCGKSTTGRSVLRLIEPTDGEILFEGTDVRGLTNEQMRKFRKQMQIVFQDPMSTLDPRWTIDKVLAEPLKIHTGMNQKEISDRIVQLLEVVGLSPFHAHKYPHEFSGGQRQRIGIAKALALNPKFIVCDEPVSALDVSIQSQALNLMRDLQEQFSLTYLFISHDLSVVKYVSDRIAVMYLGRIVEMAAADDLFTRRLHPYTQALFAAIPIPDPHRVRKRHALSGDVPNPADPPSGCTFHERCPHRMPVCSEQAPAFQEVAPHYFVACHLYGAGGEPPVAPPASMP